MWSVSKWSDLWCSPLLMNFLTYKFEVEIAFSNTLQFIRILRIIIIATRTIMLAIVLSFAIVVWRDGTSIWNISQVKGKVCFSLTSCEGLLNVCPLCSALWSSCFILCIGHTSCTCAWHEHNNIMWTRDILLNVAAWQAFLPHGSLDTIHFWVCDAFIVLPVLLQRKGQERTNRWSSAAGFCSGVVCD